MLGKIQRIAEAVGNEKIEVLRRYPQLKNILKYAYDPFMKFYMTAPDCKGQMQFQSTSDSHFELLTSLHTRELSGNAAYEKVCDHIALCTEDSAEVFKMILNKDLRCGINIKTINTAWPNLIPLTFDGSEKPAIMLLKNFDMKKAKWPMMVAVKKDGVRARFVGGQLVSRQGHKIVGCEHIEKELENFPHELDGELCIDGDIFDIASGKIRSNDPCPEAVYYVFDMPDNNGDETKEARYMWLEKNLPTSECVKIIKHQTVTNMEELLLRYRYALSGGEEGIVIYDPDSMYEDKRSYDWMRMVPLKTADCKVIGFCEGKGKHAGSLGGIIVDYKGHEVRVGTGFKEKIQLNQELREGDKNNLIFDNSNLLGTKYWAISINSQNIRKYIWDNKDIFLGAIAECEFKEETKAGSMRQPRFKRWRWDKI